MNAPRSERNNEREEARKQAKKMQQAGAKREKRNRFLLQGSLAVVSLAVVGALIAVIVAGANSGDTNNTTGPLNMQSDGIKIGQNNIAVRTAALAPEQAPIATPANDPGVVDITLFVDYLCPICGAFEEANSDAINELISRGAATVEIHPVSILDNLSNGTKYSSRAANAAACVANHFPDSFMTFHNLLFANQPAEQTTGLTDDELIQYAHESGASDMVDDCIKRNNFGKWVEASTTRVFYDGVFAINNLDPAHEKVTGTPTIFIDGKLVAIPSYLDASGNVYYKKEDFISAVQAATTVTQ